MTRLKIVFFGFIFLTLLVVAYFAYTQGLLYWLPVLSNFDNANTAESVSSDLAAALIPGPEDWVDYGHILEAGSEGDWDFLWADETPGSIVKNDGTYYFYYIAADGNTSIEGEPRHRAIGVATSQDGIHFTKYPGNPILTHAPFDGEEEGANSAGVTLDVDGKFVMYYGAAIGPRETIHANGRLAVSSDGYNFVEMGMVMNRWNPFLYGFGDEIFPVATFQYNGNWYVYYQPNGGMNERTLGITWGSRPDRLLRSIEVLDERSGGKPVGSWGNIIWLTPDRIALFIQRLWWPDTFLEVRIASPDTPHRLSEPVARYDFPNLRRGAVFLDTERRTWFLLYNDFDRFWDLKLAPAGEPDMTPPALPVNLKIEPLTHSAFKLSWQPAIDPETGVVSYNIYRDGARLGSVKDWSFTDSGLAEKSEYIYEISALNFHGYEGPKAMLRAITPADTTPPELVSVSTGGNPVQLLVTFNEPVDPASAENIVHYSIDPGVKITSAFLQPDARTVQLGTSEQSEGVLYTLQVREISDTASEPNKIIPLSQAKYMHSSIAGLVGYWNLDKGAGVSAVDVSGFGNDGVIVGASWQEGFLGGSLQFDGVDDHVFIEDEPPLRNVTDHSFTFSAWANPEKVPPANHPYAILLRVNGHPAYSFGLSYVAGGKYRAQIIADNESFFTLDSPQLAPGTWHHVAMVVDKESRLLDLYVDGKSVDDSPLEYTGNLNDLDIEAGENHIAGEYYIGSTKPDRGAGAFHTQHFMGKIDDVRIYNRGLQLEEINCLVSDCN